MAPKSNTSKRSSPVTLDDIAQQAGVTRAVVSQVLRDHPNAQRFSEATRRRIQEVAEALNYRPNFFASQLRQKNRRVMMLCVANLDDMWAATIAQSFESTLAEAGYTVLVTTLEGKADSSFVDSILGPHGIMAFAVVGYSSRRRISDAQLARLADLGVKIVAIGRDVPHPDVTQVLYDNVGGVHQALDYLLGQGARRLWVLTREPADGGQDGLTRFGRRQPALSYLAEHAADLEVTTVVAPLGAKPDPDADRRAILAALATHGRPQAVFADQDQLALELIRAFQDQGIVVGRDVAVVGYDDFFMSRYIQPRLTTIRIPQAELGRVAAEQLVRLYTDESAPSRVVTLPVELKVRESGTYRP